MKATVNQDGCIGCSACVGVCPVSAISMNGNGKAEVNDTCVGCSACVGVCPVSAISMG